MSCHVIVLFLDAFLIGVLLSRSPGKLLGFLPIIFWNLLSFNWNISMLVFKCTSGSFNYKKCTISWSLMRPGSIFQLKLCRQHQARGSWTVLRWFPITAWWYYSDKSYDINVEQKVAFYVFTRVILITCCIVCSIIQICRNMSILPAWHAKSTKAAIVMSQSTL